jgi:hypothetical protein
VRRLVPPPSLLSVLLLFLSPLYLPSLHLLFIPLHLLAFSIFSFVFSKTPHPFPFHPSAWCVLHFLVADSPLTVRGFSPSSCVIRGGQGEIAPGLFRVLRFPLPIVIAPSARRRSVIRSRCSSCTSDRLSFRTLSGLPCPSSLCVYLLPSPMWCHYTTSPLMPSHHQAMSGYPNKGP